MLSFLAVWEASMWIANRLTQVSGVCCGSLFPTELPEEQPATLVRRRPGYWDEAAMALWPRRHVLNILNWSTYWTHSYILQPLAQASVVTVKEWLTSNTSGAPVSLKSIKSHFTVASFWRVPDNQLRTRKRAAHRSHPETDLGTAQMAARILVWPSTLTWFHSLGNDLSPRPALLQELYPRVVFYRKKKTDSSLGTIVATNWKLH